MAIKPRMNMQQAEPAAYAAMFGLEKYLKQTGLKPEIRELVKIRASQINGCAYCIAMHTEEARAKGESEQRLYALSAWHESPLFSDMERAVLAFTEEATLIAEKGVSDATFERLRQHFDETGIAQLLMFVVTINAWNRIAVTMHSVYEYKVTA